MDENSSYNNFSAIRHPTLQPISNKSQHRNRKPTSQSDDETFSPIKESLLRRLSMDTRLHPNGDVDDAFTTDTTELNAFAVDLGQLRNFLSSPEQDRSSNEGYDDIATSFSPKNEQEATSKENTFVIEDLPRHDSLIQTHQSPGLNNSHQGIATESSAIENISDQAEIDNRSELSLEDVALLEAQLQTFTKFTPEQLRQRRRFLSPVPDTCDESTPISADSTTLVEISHPLHQSQASFGEQGFSPYAEISNSSQQHSESPCQQLLLSNLDPSPLGTAFLPTPPPLQEVRNTSESKPRVLNLEDFDLIPVTSSLRIPIANSQVSDDTTSLLHESPEFKVSPESITASEVNQGGILISMNTFLSHANLTTRKRFGKHICRMFNAHGVQIGVGNREDVVANSIIPLSPRQANHNDPSSPFDILGSSPAVDILNENPDWETASSLSEPFTPPGNSDAEISRMSLLDKLSATNLELREMAMELHNMHHGQTGSPAQVLSSTSPSKQRFSGPTVASWNRSILVEVQSTPSPSPLATKMASRRSRRFSDPTFASLNRSLSQGASPVPRPRRDRTTTRMVVPSQLVYEESFSPARDVVPTTPGSLASIKEESRTKVEQEQARLNTTPKRTDSRKPRSLLPIRSPPQLKPPKRQLGTSYLAVFSPQSTTQKTAKTQPQGIPTDPDVEAERTAIMEETVRKASELLNAVQTQAAAHGMEIKIEPLTTRRAGERDQDFCQRHEEWQTQIYGALGEMEGRFSGQLAEDVVEAPKDV